MSLQKRCNSAYELQLFCTNLSISTLCKTLFVVKLLSCNHVVVVDALSLILIKFIVEPLVCLYFHTKYNGNSFITYTCGNKYTVIHLVQMGQCIIDVNPRHQRWSYVSLALSCWYDFISKRLCMFTFECLKTTVQNGRFQLGPSVQHFFP